MLNMIQQSARKTLNVNRIGVADSKLATLKLGTTAKTSNVLSLIRGNSAQEQVNQTLSLLDDTPATNNAKTLTLANPDAKPTIAPNVFVNPSGGKVSEVHVLTRSDDGTWTDYTPGKANITVETYDDTPGTAVDITPMEFDTTGKADITRERRDTLTTDITAPSNAKYVTDVAPVIVNLAEVGKNFAPTTDDTNTSTKANIDLPSTLPEKSQKLNDLANGDGNWGGSYQSDLFDDNGSTTFTGTTSLPQMDLDSITQPSSAGTMTDTDVADEMTKFTQNDIMAQSTQKMLEQAKNQPQGVTQLLQ